MYVYINRVDLTDVYLVDLQIVSSCIRFQRGSLVIFAIVSTLPMSNSQFLIPELSYPTLIGEVGSEI